MAGGASGGHVAAARVAAAPAAGVTVGWERRPLGSDTWQAVPGGTTSAEPATSSSTPRVLAQTLTTSTLDATEAGSYRAVFTTPDGTIVTAVAELTILPDGSLAATGTNASPWGGIWPALLLVGIGGALLVVVRRSGRRA